MAMMTRASDFEYRGIKLIERDFPVYDRRETVWWDSGSRQLFIRSIDPIDHYFDSLWDGPLEMVGS